MDKPPEGKHSTKGLGKNIPLESENVKWRDDIVVPCGKPVASKVKASELMYNEYIVYNTAQVSYLIFSLLMSQTSSLYLFQVHELKSNTEYMFLCHTHRSVVTKAHKYFLTTSK